MSDPAYPEWLSWNARDRLSRIDRDDVLAALTALDQRERALVQASEFATSDQLDAIATQHRHVIKCRVALHAVFCDMTEALTGGSTPFADRQPTPSAPEVEPRAEWTPEALAAEAKRRKAMYDRGLCPDSGKAVHSCHRTICDCFEGDDCRHCFPRTRSSSAAKAPVGSNE